VGSRHPMSSPFDAAPANAVQGASTFTWPIPFDWWRADPTWDTAEARERAGRVAFGALAFFTFILIVAPQEFLPPLALTRPARLAAILAVLAYAFDRWRNILPARPVSAQVVIAGLLLTWSVVVIPLSYWPSGSVAMLTGLFS